MSDLVTIASDEDCSVGYLLADDATRAMTPADRVEAFVRQARSDWDLVYDPATLDIDVEPRGYKENADNDEQLILVSDPSEATSWWFVIPDLPEWWTDEAQEQQTDQEADHV